MHWRYFTSFCGVDAANSLSSGQLTVSQVDTLLADFIRTRVNLKVMKKVSRIIRPTVSSVICHFSEWVCSKIGYLLIFCHAQPTCHCSLWTPPTGSRLHLSTSGGTHCSMSWRSLRKRAWGDWLTRHLLFLSLNWTTYFNTELSVSGLQKDCNSYSSSTSSLLSMPVLSRKWEESQ